MPFVAMPSVDLGERPSGSWIVYVLADPRDDLVRYVGFTRHSLPGRLAKHLAQPTNEAMREWIGSVVSAGLVPDATTLEYVSNHQAEWQHAERRWIAWFRERGELLNVQAGGEVTRPMLKPPDKIFPLAAGDIPSKKRNPFGSRGCWDPDTDSWAAVSSVSSERLTRSRLDPRFPHSATCPCRKCAQEAAK